MADKEIETRNNALRLAYTLERQADPSTVRKLAQALQYDPTQLQKDIAALAQYVSDYNRLQKESAED